LSQHELMDSYNDITHPSLYVRLPLVGHDREYLIVWTTTPWTLPANVAAAVHPGEDYVRLETLSGTAIVAKARLEHIPLKGKVIETLKGSDLVGARYDGPFDDLEAQQGVEHRVVGWDEVSMEEGTGIVHIAPGCGAEDYELSKREGLPALIPIDEAGAFYKQYGWLHGRHTGEVAHQIIEQLGENGRLVDAGELTHRYPVCWRCGTELVYRLVDEWFISSEGVRQPMIDASRTVHWQPAQYGKRMEDWLRNMGDWCISRKRYWGLPLPFYFCASGHMSIVESKDDLLARALRGTEKLEELHRPWIDEIVIACDECGEESVRVKDVGDCWLDAGIVPFATLGYKNRQWVDHGYSTGSGAELSGADLPDNAYWEKWFPADWITESREQIRLWFYSMLFMSVVMEGRAPYSRVLTYERVTDETGRPMHKSWGNAIWFDDAVESIGADVMRWLYAAQVPSQNLGFGYGPANEVKRRLLTLWNTYSFFVIYANIDGFGPRFDTLSSGPDWASARPLDRWILARSQQLIAQCRAALDDFDGPRFVRLVETFWEDLSNWYVRLSRSRFWKSEDDADKKLAYETLWYVLVQMARLIAPVMPFLAENLWANLVGEVCPDAPDSVHLAGYPMVGDDLSDDALLDEIEAVRAVVELGRAARDNANLKVRQPLRAVIVATEDDTARRQLAMHLDLIRDELNVKDVELATSAEEFAQTEVIPNFRLLGQKYRKDVGRIQQLLKDGAFERANGEVKVGDWVLTGDEFEARTRARAGFAVVDGGGFAVALDTEITPELALEGRARDLIREIQDLRKQAGLEMTDRIRILYPDEHATTFDAHGERIKAETLALSAEQGENLAIERQ
ncbi:MAG TPA: class I tRNA ligase family protein, partial [Actinomycetota bacterium]|nr:class I tRNA ligase family protein [Actinomycetota bacterium]